MRLEELPAWLPAGPVGMTGWRVAGPDSTNPGWIRLDGPGHKHVRFLLRPERAGDDPHCCRDGWMFTYRGSPLPPGAARALYRLYQRATGVAARPPAAETRTANTPPATPEDPDLGKIAAALIEGVALIGAVACLLLSFK